MPAPKITIKIGADTGKLQKDLHKANGIVGKFSSMASGAMLGLAAAAGAAAFKIGVDGVRSAIEDEKSQKALATSLKNSTKATQEQTAAVEEYITKQQFRYGKSDVDLRRSLAKLALATNDLTKAQKLQAIALDVAAGANISLDAATAIVAKAQLGAFTAFKKLGVALDEHIVKTKDVDAATAALASKFRGQAAAAADTFQGKLDAVNEIVGEMKETIGAALLDQLKPLVDWMASPAGQKAIINFFAAFQDGVAKTAEEIAVLSRQFKNIGEFAVQYHLLDVLNALSKLGLAANPLTMFALDPLGLKNQGPAVTPTGNIRTGVQLPNNGQIGHTIVINGAIDPVGTAKTVSKVLNGAPSNLVNTTQTGKRTR